MNLYLEPPAFGLPSSDAECIAALGYCALVAPESFTVDYSAASSALVTDYLPSLHDTSADLWLSGFEEIVLHLRRLGLDADDTLDIQAKAESTAYASLIHNAAPDLTSLYLYGDEENYLSYTRKELSFQLSFPQNYIRPHTLHKQAVERMEDLSLGFSTEETSQGIFQGKKRAELRLQARQIRIGSMADALYAPFESKLSHGPFVNSDSNRPTSLDCLVFGHLSLHLFPTVPKSFLATRLKEKYPRTRKFLVDFNARFFEGGISNVMARPSFSLRSSLTAIWHEVTGARWSPARTGTIDSPESASSTAAEDSKASKEAGEWRAKAAFVGGALAVLVAFVLSNNLIVLELGDDDDDEGDAFLNSNDFHVDPDSDDDGDDDDDDLD